MEETNQYIHENRWKILFTVVMMTFVSCLDSSIVNVALPVMSKKLNVTMAAIEWVVTSYLIIIASMILIFGRLGDIKGKTCVFKFGILLFAFGSIMCGLSRSLYFLVFSRVIQAIGAAGTMATSQGIISHVFPNNERGRALGISGSFVALGTMVGPPLGGFIVSVWNWQSIFWINVPICLFTFLAGMKILPRSEKDTEEKLDIKGSTLFIIAIVFLFGALTQGQIIGYNHWIIIMLFALAIIALITFIFVEKQHRSPLLELTLFKNRLFSLSIFCSFISFTCISGVNIIHPFYLQYVLKYSPQVTGFYMMAFPVVLSIVAPASGYLSDKIGSEFLTFLGLCIMAFGLFLMSQLNEYATMGILIISIAIMSMGNGLFQSPNTSLIMSTVPKTKLGIAGSMNALVRNIGMVFGISTSTTLLYNRMSYAIGHRVVNYIEGRDDVFIDGMQFVYLTASFICIVGIVLTAWRLYKRKKQNIE